MYTRAELRPAFDALWAVTRDLLRDAGMGQVPDALSVVDDGLLAFWQRPDLLLGQTCGYPYRHFLADRVALVGTPDFAVQGCAPGYYRSAWVVRADDPRQALGDFQGATLACNDVHSQSGHAATLVAAHGAGVAFGALRISGAHVASARMVAGHQADIAGIDAVSWRHMTRFDPWAAGLRVLGWTEPTPGLPFITAFAPLAPTIRRCLAQAIGAMPGHLREDLTLTGLVQIDAADYRRVPDPPEPLPRA